MLRIDEGELNRSFSENLVDSGRQIVLGRSTSLVEINYPPMCSTYSRIVQSYSELKGNESLLRVRSGPKRIATSKTGKQIPECHQIGPSKCILS